MDDREILRSNREGFKALPAHALRILLVDRDRRFRASVASRLTLERGAVVEAVAGVAEADRVARDQQFDLILFGNPDWEAGMLLYLDLLNLYSSPCKFILFINERLPPPPQLDGLVRVVRKPGPDGSLDWLTST